MTIINKHTGFTIVELLVVIVIIAILAAITIVSYTGISSRATVSSLQSDLTNAVTQLKLDQVNNSSFPASLALANGGKGIPSSSGTSYTYAYSNTTIPQTFCITATKNNISYNITQDGNSQPGICPVLNLDAGNISSYPGTGTTWTDLSGNGNSGTLNGGVTYSNTNGGVLSFNGVSGYVSLPVGATSVINGTNNFTISIYARIYAGYSYYPLFNKGSPGTNPIGFTFHTGRFEGGDGISNKFDNSLFSLSTTFSNYVITYDGLSVKIYINGVYFTSFAWTYGFGNLTAVPAYIGLFWGPYGKEDISNVSIYNKALNANEILQNFNNLRGRYGI